MAKDSRFEPARIEAANRAEATASLIRCGYSVYRPEADIDGEDLVLRTPAPDGKLLAVQLKGRATVDLKRYGGRGLWMLFPSTVYQPDAARTWYLVPHDDLFARFEAKHGRTPKWSNAWSVRDVSTDLAAFLGDRVVRPPAEPESASATLTGEL
jgi:hypothetical protein